MAFINRKFYKRQLWKRKYVFYQGSIFKIAHDSGSHNLICWITPLNMHLKQTNKNTSTLLKFSIQKFSQEINSCPWIRLPWVRMFENWRPILNGSFPFYSVWNKFTPFPRRAGCILYLGNLFCFLLGSKTETCHQLFYHICTGHCYNVV